MLDLPTVTSVLRRAIRHNKVLELTNPGHAEHGAVLAAIQAANAPHAVACGQPGRPLRAAQPEIRPGRRNSRQPNRETC